LPGATDNGEFRDGWTTGGDVSRIKSYSSALEVAMRTTQQLSITLPNDMADVVKAKVRTGEYATESEVIRDGLRALLARDRAIESWLQQQVGPAYDALKADPSRAVTADQVRARLAAEHAKAR
jgi:putative addiction module CopG family antidote